MTAPTDHESALDSPFNDAEEAADAAEKILDIVIAAKGGTRRDGQIKMAREVASNLTRQYPIMIQAGTGTGKSLGYLAGALAADKQVVVATHTKALQDQLVDDLELISAAAEEVLAEPLRYTVIKGRSSYACLSKIKGTSDAENEQGSLLDETPTAAESSGELGQQVKALYGWVDTTDSGDRAEVPFDVSTKAWEQVSVTAEDCSGKHCPFYGSCFAEKARRKAKDAHIIVVNQALLAMSMRFPLLPETVEAIIVDEAHEFDGVVSTTFGAQVTIERLRQTLKKIVKVVEPQGGAPVKQDEEVAKGAIDGLAETLPVPRNPDRDVIGKPEFAAALKRCQGAFGRFASRIAALPSRDEKEKAGKDLLNRMLTNLVFELDVLERGSTEKQVAWVEAKGKKPVMRSAQFDVGDTIFARLIREYRSVVFTSATLTVAGSFQIPARTYGFAQGPWTSTVVESPFDYGTQSLVWFPEDMPTPSPPRKKNRGYTPPAAGEITEYARAVAKVSGDCIEAANGRTMVLCTSWSNVDGVAELLQHRFGGKHQIIVQERGGTPARVLARRFAEDPHSILVGTRTFWAGISIEGATCSCVVLDKMPFPSPSDPIVAARTEAADRRQERSGFREVSVSSACLTMTQGSGRLIRTVHDKGVVVVCDPRINREDRDNFKPMYGHSVLKSLPPMPHARDREHALSFLREVDRTANDALVRVEIETEDDT